MSILWAIGSASTANPLLSKHHYLGPIKAGGHTLILEGRADDGDGEVVAAQVWRRPTARNLPANGTWLELSRWCLTPEAGANAGSRMHRFAVRVVRNTLPSVTTLVSYSDPSHGHNGALYRACNWRWAPTWHRLRTPPTGNGSWTTGQRQSVKDRWVFEVRPDLSRASVLFIDDAAAIRHWRQRATPNELRWASSHPQLIQTPDVSRVGSNAA